ncbi:MAG: TolC family protein [Prosthecobacter sp.]|uniref:TolC family protein n=1 Tax=Prosthecobacter sp. TaxID=1965333 RepID=UPI00390153A5
MLLSFTASAVAVESATEERLSLRAVILKALENNNDIMIEDLGRLVELEKIKVASQALNPKLEGSYIYQSIRTPQNTQDYIATGGGINPGATPILTSPNTFMQRNHVSKLTLVDKLATGATIELGTTMRVLNNSINRRIPPGIFNPEWETFTGLTVTQPLLRGFGKDANLAEIRIAKANAKMADYEWQSRTSAVVAEVMKRYYDVIFTRENIAVQKEGIELAEKLLGDTRKRSNEGVAANNDVVVAEAGVYQRREEVLAAELQYIERQNALQLLFKRSNEVFSKSARIVPVDGLSDFMPPTSRTELMGLAVNNRYEVKQAEEFINARNAQTQLAHNQSLSRLDFVASGGLHGLDGNVGQTYSNAFQSQGPEWTAGVQFSVPLNRDNQKATERLAYHQQEQAVRQAEKLRLQVLLEVDTVYNRVRIDQERLAATRKSREAARQSADAELKRLQQGVSTSYQVLQLQRNYSQAQSRELAALADFNKSLADLYLTTATLLQKQRINITVPAPPPAVAPANLLPQPVKSAVVPTKTVEATKKAPVPPKKTTLGGRISKFFGRGERTGE